MEYDKIKRMKNLGFSYEVTITRKDGKVAYAYITDEEVAYRLLPLDEKIADCAKELFWKIDKKDPA